MNTDPPGPGILFSRRQSVDVRAGHGQAEQDYKDDAAGMLDAFASLPPAERAQLFKAVGDGLDEATVKELAKLMPAEAGGSAPADTPA